MAVLETTFVIDLLRGKPQIKELKDELDKTEATLAIAAPSVMEIWSGAELSNVPESERVKINELLLSLIVLVLDEKAAKKAGEIEAGLLKAGQPIDTEDVMIAAIALVNGEKVVTRDAHYSRIPGLRVLKY